MPQKGWITRCTCKCWCRTDFVVFQASRDQQSSSTQLPHDVKFIYSFTLFLQGEVKPAGGILTTSDQAVDVWNPQWKKNKTCVPRMWMLPSLM